MNYSTDFTAIPRKLNVLLAEDDSADRLLFEDALTELPVSANFTTVSNGEELLHWLIQTENKLPDVLFLDLNMPRKNGFASLGEIKRNPELENLPVFIFSTEDHKAMIEQVFKDAAHYFIRKPIKFSDLKKLIYKALTLIAEDNTALPPKEYFILKK